MAAPLTFEAFRQRFGELVFAEQMSWEAVGFLSPDDRIYPFGTDSKGNFDGYLRQLPRANSASCIGVRV